MRKRAKENVVFVARVERVVYDGAPRSDFKIVTLDVREVQKGELKRNG